MSSSSEPELETVGDGEGGAGGGEALRDLQATAAPVRPTGGARGAGLGDACASATEGVGRSVRQRGGVVVIMASLLCVFLFFNYYIFLIVGLLLRVFSPQ